MFDRVRYDNAAEWHNVFSNILKTLHLKHTAMKKLAMMICGLSFISMMAVAQIDSTDNRNGSTGINDNNLQNDNSTEDDSGIQNPTLDRSVNPQPSEPAPQTLDRTLPPSVQPLPQSQPQIEPQPQVQPQSPVQSQPDLKSEPFQPQPQVPTQSQPLDPNYPLEQNRLNQPIQPTQPAQPMQPTISPTPTEPTGSGLTPPR